MFGTCRIDILLWLNKQLKDVGGGSGIENRGYESVMFFLTKFPQNATKKDSWELCAKHGCVSDVYLANKLIECVRKFVSVILRVGDKFELAGKLRSV